MQSMDHIRDHLAKSTERVLSKVEEMRDHGTVFPTPNGGGHTLWVLGHLAYIEGQVVRHFMLGESNPLAEWESPFDGSDVSAEPGDYPPFEEVISRCREMRAETVALLDRFQEEDLDRVSANAPKGFEDTFGTYRHCFQFVSDHWYMHRGQLADARRAAGLHRMWF
ncbi:MAG: DinB family protein [Planctomycetota bacterium]